MPSGAERSGGGSRRAQARAKEPAAGRARARDMTARSAGMRRYGRVPRIGMSVRQRWRSNAATGTRAEHDASPRRGALSEIGATSAAHPSARSATLQHAVEIPLHVPLGAPHGFLEIEPPGEPASDGARQPATGTSRRTGAAAPSQANDAPAPDEEIHRVAVAVAALHQDRARG